jgi:cell division protein FtsI (penicillin-binding protein 3)
MKQRRRNRLIGVFLGLGFLFSLLIAQFYMIQIVEGDKWLAHAHKQHFFIVKEPFIRGTFYSNPFIKKGHPAQPQQLVLDIPKFHLYADPEALPQLLKRDIAKHLAAHLSLSSEERLKLEQQLNKPSRSRKLVGWLDKTSQQILIQWWQPYARQHKIPRNALFFVKDYQRSYPYEKLLGQVLHTIRYQKEEATNQAFPTGGLELYCNQYLKGKVGKRRLMRSPRNSLETGEVISHPENGADIYLTINPYLQAIAEEEIEKGVKKSKAKRGWAGIMDPHTGEVLALAQYPFFYPPDYADYFNDVDKIEHTKVRAVTDANEPGSVFKPFTIVLALQANQFLRKRGLPELFSDEEKIATSNGRFPGRSKPITDTSLHHYLNLNMAMQKSSNIYMGRLAERMINRLGNEWYRRQLQLLGFGQKTQIELPAESAGVLPTPGKLHPCGALEWSIPTPFSLAIGHNLQVTTLQLLRGYSLLANGGFLVTPTLIRSIVKKDLGSNWQVVLDHTSPERIKNFPRVLSQQIVDRVLESMRYVTKPGGTAVKADVSGYTEVGKSSTPKKIIGGQYSERLYCPTFAGFTPVNHPVLVVVITIDEPEYGYIPGIGKNHHGGNCTADVFREIAQRSLEYLGIPLDDPFGYPHGDPRRDDSKIQWMNETRKLQEKYDKWNK